MFFFLIIIIIIIFLFQVISFTAVEQYFAPKKENKMSWFKTMITFRRRYYNLNFKLNFNKVLSTLFSLGG